MKYTYPDKLWIRPSDDTMKQWVLQNDFRIFCDGDLVDTVNGGFRTDFASIPWGFRNILPKTGRYGKPAVGHDHRYYTGDIPRADADLEFYYAMRSQKVNWLTAKTMYLAVRAGAWVAWNNHRKRDDS